MNGVLSLRLTLLTARIDIFFEVYMNKRFDDFFSYLVIIVGAFPRCGIWRSAARAWTGAHSYGMIAGENKTLICYVSYFELQKMKEIIARNKGSFSTVSTVDEILR